MWEKKLGFSLSFLWQEKLLHFLHFLLTVSFYHDLRDTGGVVFVHLESRLHLGRGWRVLSLVSDSSFVAPMPSVCSLLTTQKECLLGFPWSRLEPQGPPVSCGSSAQPPLSLS